MFLVPTYVSRSHIHGFGVFAARPIPAGTLVWEFTEGVDWRLEASTMERFPEPFQSRLREWSYREASGLYILCGDNAKFMNHADEPNCDDTGEFTRAREEIAAEEELTCDYRAFDIDVARHGLDYTGARAESVAAR